MKESIRVKIKKGVPAPETPRSVKEKSIAVTLDMKHLLGLPRSRVMQDIQTQRGEYYIPGPEDQKNLLTYPADEIQPEVKDGNSYYFMGKLSYNSHNEPMVSSVCWNGEKLIGKVVLPSFPWLENDRVLLRKK